MNPYRHVLCAFAVLFLLTPHVLLAQDFDLYQSARDSVNLSLSPSGSGMTIRGGIGLHTLIPAPDGQILFRGRGSTGSLCGFDAVLSFADHLDDLPGVLEALVRPLILGLALVELCKLLPSFCDVAKHLQNFINVLIRAQYAQCQDIMLGSQNRGVRDRADARSQCLQDAQADDMTLNQALEACGADGGPLEFLTGPNGLQAVDFDLIEQALTTVGFDLETAERVARFAGTVRFSTDGSFLNRERTGRRENALGIYQQRVTEITESINLVVDDLRNGVEPPAALRVAISAPGAPVDDTVLEKLVTEHDPARRAHMTNKMAGALAYVHTVWELLEVIKALETAETLGDMPDAQREALEGKRRLLQQEVHRFTTMRAALRPVEEVSGALLTQQGQQMQEIRTVTVSAPSNRRVRTKYETGQSTLGTRW